ncbi:MAG: proton-conducting membrane transporter [Halodesulfurarchaeum sp.]|nr:proton-conducting membrane transporter [Halodesulfurarchaeum sp.]
MTTKPELSRNVDVLPGLAALALFAMMAVAILTATFEPAVGFEPGAAITKSMGYALFNLERGAPMVASEGFLLPFFAVAFVLDAALGAAVMLARRDGGED